MLQSSFDFNTKQYRKNSSKQMSQDVNTTRSLFDLYVKSSHHVVDPFFKIYNVLSKSTCLLTVCRTCYQLRCAIKSVIK